MSRFLFAWELGLGFGHVGEMLPVARNLRDRGHEVVFAVCSFAIAKSTLGPEGFAYVAAPVWTGAGARENAPADSFTDLLRNCGYVEPTGLAELIGAWRDIYRSVAPDFLVADHAPTGMLAARAHGLRRAAMGIGFYFPTISNDGDGLFQPLRPWAEVDTGGLAAMDRAMLETINAALAIHEAPPLESLADLLAGEEMFLCTLPEIDHYGVRHNVPYRGPIYSKMFSTAPDWPPTADAGEAGRRVFAFLNVGTPRFEDVFRHLRNLGTPCFAYVRGGDDAKLRELAGDGGAIRITGEPVDLASVIETCGAIICNGGHATIAAALLAGKPMMIIPDNVEQAMIAHQLGKSGACLGVGSRTGDDVLGQLIGRLATDEGLGARAKKIAAPYAGLDMAMEVDHIAARLSELV